MHFTNSSVNPEAYPRLPQTSMMESFVTIVNGNLSKFEFEYIFSLTTVQKALIKINYGFLISSGSTEMGHWREMG